MKILTMLLTIFLSGGCTPQHDIQPPGVQQPTPPPPPQQPDPPTSNHMTLRINNREFSATLSDGPAAMGFRQLLPLRINMSEINGNEKYYNLPTSLPSAAQNMGRVSNGDIMLFGSSTLVVFYKSFSTSYTYTRIGRVDNPSDLEAVLGRGAVVVEFEIE